MNNQCNWKEENERIKRKAAKEQIEDDNISISSNISIMSFKEGFKRRCSLPKLPNLSQLMQQHKSFKKMGDSIQRTFSFKDLNSLQIPTHKLANISRQTKHENLKSVMKSMPQGSPKFEHTPNQEQLNIQRRAMKNHLKSSGKIYSLKHVNLIDPFFGNMANKEVTIVPPSVLPNDILHEYKAIKPSISQCKINMGETLYNKSPNHKHDSIKKNLLTSELPSSSSLLINALISSPFRNKSQTLSCGQYNKINNNGVSNYPQSPLVLSGQIDQAYKPKRYKIPERTPSNPSACKRLCWSEVVKQENITDKLTPSEIKRQEAIYEFYTGEIDTLSDLNCLRRVYLESLKCLNLIKSDEIESTFRSLPQIITLHKEIIKSIETVRHANTKVIAEIGQVILEWVSGLSCYIDYCGNIDNLRSILERRYRQDSKMRDFLERCQNSPFSRRLDIWSFIDLPRTRLVKYPLLFKQILKYTPPQHKDTDPLTHAIIEVEMIIKQIDHRIGYNKCLQVIDNLEYTHDYQKHPSLQRAQQLLCSGPLKNQKGVKLQAFLFDTVFILTRPASFNVKNPEKYCVYKRPLAIEELHLITPLTSSTNGQEDSNLQGLTKSSTRETSSDLHLLVVPPPVMQRQTSQPKYHEGSLHRTVNESDVKVLPPPVDRTTKSPLKTPIDKIVHNAFDDHVSTTSTSTTNTRQEVTVKVKNSAIKRVQSDHQPNNTNIHFNSDLINKNNPNNNNNNNSNAYNANKFVLQPPPTFQTNFEFKIQLRQELWNPSTKAIHSYSIVEEHALSCRDVHDMKMWIDSISCCIKAYNEKKNGRNLSPNVK